MTNTDHRSQHSVSTMR